MRNTNKELMECIKDYQAGGISDTQWIFIEDFISRVGWKYKSNHREIWDDLKGDALIYITSVSMNNCDTSIGEKYCYRFMRKSIIGVFMKRLNKMELEDEYTEVGEGTIIYGDIKRPKLGGGKVDSRIIYGINNGNIKLDYIIIKKQSDIDNFLYGERVKNAEKIKRTWYIDGDKVKVGDVIIGAFSDNVNRLFIYSQEEFNKVKEEVGHKYFYDNGGA